MLIPIRRPVRPNIEARPTIFAALGASSASTPIRKDIWRRKPHLPNLRWSRSAESLQQSHQQILRPHNLPVREPSPTFAPWIQKSAKQSPEHVRNVAWPWSRRQWNTPAPCILKSFATAREIVPYAVWPLSPVSPPVFTPKTILNCAACSGGSGLALCLAFLCLRFPWAAWPLEVRSTTCPLAGWNGCNLCLPHRWFSGEAGH